MKCLDRQATVWSDIGGGSVPTDRKKVGGESASMAEIYHSDKNEKGEYKIEHAMKGRVTLIPNKLRVRNQIREALILGYNGKKRER